MLQGFFLGKATKTYPTEGLGVLEQRAHQLGTSLCVCVFHAIHLFVYLLNPFVFDLIAIGS